MNAPPLLQNDGPKANQPTHGSLEQWSRLHALALSVACAVSITVRQPAITSLCALVSFGALVVRHSGHWTSSGVFGAANRVTALRLAILLTMSVALHRGSGLLWGALLLLIFALDGLDGFLARRGQLASEFGAHFDMESDALLVLVCGLELWLSGVLGFWILVPGLLRYAYVLAVSVVPPRGPEMPRSRFGRYAFSTLVIGLIAAFVLPKPFSGMFALVGSVTVSVSFVRSFYWAYLRKATS